MTRVWLSRGNPVLLTEINIQSLTHTHTHIKADVTASGVRIFCFFLFSNFHELLCICVRLKWMCLILCLKGLMSSVVPDYVLPYTIHLLAHDPDFKSFDHLESLKNLKEWVEHSTVGVEHWPWAGLLLCNVDVTAVLLCCWGCLCCWFLLLVSTSSSLCLPWTCPTFPLKRRDETIDLFLEQDGRE